MGEVYTAVCPFFVFAAVGAPGDGAVEASFGGDAFLAGDVGAGGVEGAAGLLAVDEEVLVSLEAGGESPFDGGRIEDVYVGVYDPDVFEGAVSFEGGFDGETAVFRPLFVYLDDGVEPRGTAGGDVDAGAAGDFIDLGEDGWFFGHPHEQLMLEAAGEESVIDGVATVGDEVYFDDGLLADDVHCFG